MNQINFSKWCQLAQTQTELVLSKYLPSDTERPSKLHQAMRYATLGGGKRIRAMLAIASAQIDDFDEEALNQAISAIEMIHAYSLIHDDLPCMDNDDMRRGKPSCHIAFGEAPALLAGDALLTHAFSVLSQPNNLPASQQLSAIATLANASGCLNMVGGQFIDFTEMGNNLSQAVLEEMHSKKTGALIQASVTLGFYTHTNPNPDTLKILQYYAQKLGLAFQIKDDVLDSESDSATLGKTAGKDERDNKTTFVSLMGIESAKKYAENLKEQAIGSLAPLKEKGYLLEKLANLIIDRTY